MKNTVLKELDELKLSVELDFYCSVDRDTFDFGLVTLKKDGRSLILDVVRSTSSENGDTIYCEMEFDEELIEDMDSKSDLRVSDLNNLDEAIIFIGDEFEQEPDSITLFFRKNGCTSAIDMNED